MKNMKKKGFTLVELLVVIAIIAILATVSVVGYTAFMKKADLSNDQTTIEMLNDNLQAAATGQKLESAGDAINLLKQAGIFGEKLTAYSKNYKYVYNTADKSFYLVDDASNVVYPEAADKANLWGIFTGKSSDKIDGITNYVATQSLSGGTVKTVMETNFADCTFDFAGNVCAIDEKIDGITLLNAITTADWDLEGATYRKVTTVAATATGSTIKDATVPVNAGNRVDLKAGETFVFENCVFLGQVSLVENTNVTFINCVFANMGGTDDDYAVRVGTADNKAGSVTFDGCEFAGVRGILLNNPSEVTIKNCTFKLPTQSVDNHAIRYNYSKADAITLTVTNNQFVSGSGIVRASAAIAEGSNITFSGNTIGEGVDLVVSKSSDNAADAIDWFKKNIK